MTWLGHRRCQAFGSFRSALDPVAPVLEDRPADELDRSGVAGVGRKVGLGGLLLVVAVGTLVLVGCVGDVTDTTRTPMASTSGVPATDAATDLETTTTSTTLSVLVSLTQVLGGSVSEDASQVDEVAVTYPEHPEESYMTAVTVMNSGLVAGGAVSPANAETSDAAVWVSSDGRVWTRGEDEAGVFGDASSATGVPGDQVINDVAGGSLGVVAVGADGLILAHDAAVWISSDGLVWERLAHDADVFGGEGDQFMHSVVQTSGSVIVVGESGGVAAAWVSRDGSQWARADVNDESIRAGAEPSVMNDVAVAGAGLVAVGSAGVDLGPAVWLSPDGVTWERLVDSMAGEQSGFSTDDSAMSSMTAVAAGERGLVAIGTKLRNPERSSTTAERSTLRPVVWTSDNGYEWQLLDSGFLEVTDQQETSRYAYLKGGSPVLLEDVAWDGDRMLAIGGYELAPSANDIPSFVTLWTSADGGSTWHVAGETTLPPTGSQSHRGARSSTRLGDSVVLVGSDDIPAGKHPEYGWMTYAATPGAWIANLPAP